MRRQMLCSTAGFLILMLTTSCNLAKKASDTLPEARKNTLSAGDFADKADAGAGIFAGIKSVRGKFDSHASVKTVQGFDVNMLVEGFNDIDLDSEDCVSQGEPALDVTAGVEIYYQTFVCKLAQDGGNKTCTITVGTNAVGLEVSRAESCTSSSSTQTSTTDHEQSMTGVDPSAYMPQTDDVSDCQSAFDMFESLFSQAEKDFTEMSAVLKNPESFSDDQTKLEKAPLADDEAVAFLFLPKQEMPGFSVQGRVAGGGTTEKFTIRQNMNLTIDFAQMSMPFPGAEPADMPAMDAGKQEILINRQMNVDLDSRVVNSSMDMTSTQKQDGGESEGVSVKGSIEVSDGLNKYVTQKLAFGNGNGLAAMTADVNAVLVDENTMQIDAGFTGENAPQGVSLIITKQAGGQCKVVKK